MQAFLISTLSVATAEMGDKTQLLAIMLTSRYKRPYLILLGILLATLANHLLAGTLGLIFKQMLSPLILPYILATSYILAAIWLCIPDKAPEDSAPTLKGWSLLLTVMFTFFIAEIGDKTQIATTILAATYSPLWMIVLGTTTGMMLANLPAVILGQKLSQHPSLSWLRYIAAIVFLGLGLKMLFF